MEIVKYPDPRLRVKCKPVTEITDEMREQAEKMIDLMFQEDGVGLAATQVGLDYRMIVLRDMSDEDEHQGVAFINPEIISQSGSVLSEEGCLSLPRISGKLDRAEKVTVRAMDLDGETIEVEADEIYAIAFQHEIDHLNGVIFIDKISPAKKIAISLKLKKLEREFANKKANSY